MINFIKSWKCVKCNPVLWVLLFISTSLFAQDNSYYSKVVPPSPTSSVFDRYGNHQPSLSTGTINIPIHLFELTVGDLSIPFTLSYNTSGINVYDMPYPSGYGWVFSPGLRVTRTILGRSDIDYPFESLPGGENYDDLMPGIIDDQYSALHGISQNELFDTQHDIFTAHLPSGSYKFLINQTTSSLDFVTIGNSLKIESIGALKGFKITDDKGIIYKFGMYENEQILNDYVEYPGGDNGFTAWTLREVLLPNGDVISFSWKSVNLNNFAMDTSTPVSINDYKTMCSETSQPDILDYGGNVSYQSYAYANVKALEKVEFPGGEINISYKADNDPFMTGFQVKNARNVVCRNVVFQYGAGLPESALLQALTIDDQSYVFDYNNNWFPKNSTSLDYWGYYNGKPNVTLIPKVKLKLFDDYTEVNPATADVAWEVGTADRSVDGELMQAFMLTKITYPTGGYSEFEYEPHQFSDQYPASTGAFGVVPPPINKGGGLRVSKITTKADPTAQATIKEYRYGENENGLANITCVPTLDTFIDEFWYFEEFSNPINGLPDTRAYRRLNVNALSSYSKYLVGPVPIWYSLVTEYTNGHKTEYEFEYNEDHCSYSLQFKLIKKPYILYYMGLFQDGPRQEKKTVYKSNGTSYSVVKETVYSYEMVAHPNIYYAMIEDEVIDRKVINVSLNNDGPDIYDQDILESTCYLESDPIEYNRIPYRIYVRYYRLADQQVTTYNDVGAAFITTESRTYNNQYQLSKIINSASDASNPLTVEYKYPQDFTDPVYVEMGTKNMIAPVIEEVSYRGTIETRRRKTNYTKTLSVTTGLILPGSIQESSLKTGSLRTAVVFDKYDEKANVLQYTPVDPTGPHISYLWNYKGQYPVAEAKNAAFSDIAYTGFEADGKGNWSYSGTIGTSPGYALTGKKYYAISGNMSKSGLVSSKKYLLSYWQKGGTVAVSAGAGTVGAAVTGISHNGWTHIQRRISGATTVTLSGSGYIDQVRLHPIDAQMTTYTYDPLIGTTSQTDASGKITYYEYDAFQRLKAARNLNGELLESYDYHYRNQ